MSFDLPGRKLAAPIDQISERDLARTISDALNVDFGNLNSKSKRIAKAAGAGSEKSADNWLHGYNAPSMLYGLRLMAKSPSMAKEILRLCALDQDLDPDFQREFANLMQRMRPR